MKQPEWLGKKPTVLPTDEIELPDGSKRFRYPARAPLVTADGREIYISEVVKEAQHAEQADV